MENCKTYKGKWYEFTTGWSGFNIKYELAGYFDVRPLLQIYFIWGKLFLYFPWKHYKKKEIPLNIAEIRLNKLDKLAGKKIKKKKKFEKIYYDESDPPRYGVYYYMDEFWFCYGKKVKSVAMPWNLDWVRTSMLRNDGTWENHTRKNKKEFWDVQWKDILLTEKYPYTYTTKYGETQKCIATIQVKEMEWRWIWFKWLKLTRYVKRTIDIEFSNEVGDRAGSWKGGVTGCSYEMLKGETPQQTLKRMENERIFK